MDNATENKKLEIRPRDELIKLFAEEGFPNTIIDWLSEIVVKDPQIKGNVEGIDMEKRITIKGEFFAKEVNAMISSLGNYAATVGVGLDINVENFGGDDSPFAKGKALGSGFDVVFKYDLEGTKESKTAPLNRIMALLGVMTPRDD